MGFPKVLLVLLSATAFAAPAGPPAVAGPSATVTNGDEHTTTGEVQGTCTGHESQLEPPKTIRVLLYRSHDRRGWGVPGSEFGVRVVPFQDYVRDVLPAEWPNQWPAESLQAGAVAVKEYAWYWTQHWRGGQFRGACFDVDDSVRYQRYIPNLRKPTTDDAIQATWGTVLYRDGRLFPTGYRSTLTDRKSERCGEGRDVRPNTLSQWGSRVCALGGMSSQDILGTYYPNTSSNEEPSRAAS